MSYAATFFFWFVNVRLFILTFKGWMGGLTRCNSVAARVIMTPTLLEFYRSPH